MVAKEKSKGTKIKKRGNDKNLNKTSEESSSSTAGKSNIKNMLLNMGKDSGKSLKRNRDNSGIEMSSNFIRFLLIGLLI